jgi:hypothetical protein
VHGAAARAAGGHRLGLIHYLQIDLHFIFAVYISCEQHTASAAGPGPRPGQSRVIYFSTVAHMMSMAPTRESDRKAIPSYCITNGTTGRFHPTHDFLCSLLKEPMIFKLKANLNELVLGIELITHRTCGGLRAKA